MNIKLAFVALVAFGLVACGGGNKPAEEAVDGAASSAAGAVDTPSMGGGAPAAPGVGGGAPEAPAAPAP